MSVDGRETSSIGSARVCVETEGFKEMVNVDVMESLAGHLDVILGIDFIGAVGGIEIKAEGVQWKGPVSDATVTVSNVDFEARFDGEAWKVKWNWKDGEPPELKNRIAAYDTHMEQSLRVKYEEKVKEWVRDGWLKKCENQTCLLYTSPSPRDKRQSRMPSSA